MNYTLNNLAPATLHVEDVSVTIENQADDRALVTFALDAAEALPPMFDYDNIVTIRDSTRALFSGRCMPRSTDEKPSTEGASVELRGPWADLSQITYRQVYTDPRTGAAYASGRCSLSGSIATIVQTLINFAIAQGANCQLGTIDLPGLTVPRLEASDQSIAGWLQQVLKWVPTAVVVFDYSAVPPIAHVSRLGSTQLLEVSAPGDSASYKARTDLVPKGITITYERTYRIVRKQSLIDDGYVSTQEDSKTFVGVDAVGVDGFRNGVQVTVQLEGAQEMTVTSHKFMAFYYSMQQWLASSNAIGNMLWVTGQQMDQQAGVGRFYDGRYPYCTSAQVTYTNEDGVAVSYPHGAVWPLPNRSDVRQYRGVPDPMARKDPRVTFVVATVTTIWAASPSGAEGLRRTAQFLCVAGVSPAGRTATWSQDTTGDTLVAAVPGVAAAIMAQWGQVYYEGGVEADLASITWAHRVALVAGVRSPIQRISWSLSSEQAVMAFGPPTHLRPADFLDLINPVA